MTKKQLEEKIIELEKKMVELQNKPVCLGHTCFHSCNCRCSQSVPQYPNPFYPNTAAGPMWINTTGATSMELARQSSTYKIIN